MIITKESKVLRAGSRNSKQITIPVLISEILDINVDDILVWKIDAGEENPRIEIEIVKKE